MKTVFKRVCALLIVATMILSFANSVQATQSVAGNFYRNYTLTGNGADDIVAVAQAQLGRSQSNIGYTEAWCADFVSDCARLAGVESLIPFNGGVSYLRNAMLNAGCSIVSSRQKGDIVFYYCKYCGAWTHVGIVQDGTYSIEGNVNGQVYKVGGSNGNYMDVNGHTLGSGITREYIRPKYSTHTCSYSSSVTKVATCNATGVRTYSCSCGKSYTETIAKNASNHVGGTVIKNAVAATPESTGYTGDTYCGGCSKLLKTGTTIPKIDETQWVYVSSLPSHVSADKYDIEYNNIYKKVATTDNASGWTKGSLAKTEYVNSGSTYESDFELSTSKTRVLVSYYYYHWCGSDTGNYINYAYTDSFNHYDAYYETSAVVEEQSVADSDDSRYTAYKLAWAHDTSAHCWCAPALTCDASNSHDYRSPWWYKRYVYQDKKAVMYYNFTKESGWTDSKDSAANSVEYRYKLKEHECSYTSSVTTAATCKKAGVRTYTCECGDSYTEPIPVLAHKIVTDKAVAATCTSTGKTEGKHCSVCGTVTVEPTVISKKEHTDGNWEVLFAPTFKAEGTQVKKCTVCKTVLEERTIPKLDKMPEIEIKRTSTTVVNYGETLVLQLEEIELPEGYAVAWFVEGAGFSAAISEDRSECYVTSIANGNATFSAVIVDEEENPIINPDGEEIFDEITIVSKAGFWQKFISFFKNLFGINRVIY